MFVLILYKQDCPGPQGKLVSASLKVGGMSSLSPSPHTFLSLWSISPVSSFFKEGLSGGYISSKDFFLSLPLGTLYTAMLMFSL